MTTEERVILTTLNSDVAIIRVKLAEIIGDCDDPALMDEPQMIAKDVIETRLNAIANKVRELLGASE